MSTEKNLKKKNQYTKIPVYVLNFFLTGGLVCFLVIEIL